MTFNYPILSRSLIALLFVVAGVQKIMNFDGFTATVASLGFPMPALFAGLVVFIEVVVALAYAYGYRVCLTGGTLVAFTVIVTVLVHRDISSSMVLVTALKNIAIIGGILATTGACSCGRCYSLNPKK